MKPSFCALAEKIDKSCSTEMHEGKLFVDEFDAAEAGLKSRAWTLASMSLNSNCLYVKSLTEEKELPESNKWGAKHTSKSV